MALILRLNEARRLPLLVLMVLEILLKIALGQMEPNAESNWGYGPRSYFAQDHHDLLKERTSNDWICSGTYETVGLKRPFGQVLFTGDEVEKVSMHWKRGISATIVYEDDARKGNVLVLDELTNHMDLEGVEVRRCVAKIWGYCTFVSHDRHFVSKVATHILELTQRERRHLALTKNIWKIWRWLFESGSRFIAPPKAQSNSKYPENEDAHQSWRAQP